MTYTVDEAAVRRTKARLENDAGTLRSSAQTLVPVTPGGMSALVNDVAAALARTAATQAAAFDTAAGNLEAAIVLSRLADLDVQGSMAYAWSWSALGPNASMR